MKTCGTRECNCDCGTTFSRRDSFITHRAFCDALAEESAKAQSLAVSGNGGGDVKSKSKRKSRSLVNVNVASPPPPPLTPSTSVLSPGLSIQSSEMPENNHLMSLSPPTPMDPTSTTTSNCSSASVFASVFAPPPSTANQISALSYPISTSIMEPTSLSLSPSLYGCSLFAKPEIHYSQSTPQGSQPPVMSATALLQKAAQIGSATSNSSLLRGFGLSISSEDSHLKQDNNNTGLGLGLCSSLSDVMMDPSSLFGNKPTRLDLLGLGIGVGVGAGGASTSGLSALLTSFETGGFDLESSTDNSRGGGSGHHHHHHRPWEDSSEKKPQ